MKSHAAGHLSYLLSHCILFVDCPFIFILLLSHNSCLIASFDHDPASSCLVFPLVIVCVLSFAYSILSFFVLFSFFSSDCFSLAYGISTSAFISLFFSHIRVSYGTRLFFSLFVRTKHSSFVSFNVVTTLCDALFASLLPSWTAFHVSFLLSMGVTWMQNIGRSWLCHDS